MKKHKGFTLIELLVVIAIIGILSGIVLANLSTAKKKSRDAKRVSDVAQLQLALELFFEKCHAYPTTITDLNYPSGYANSGTNCPTGVNWGTFQSSIPKPPAGAGDTNYLYFAKYQGCLGYHLGAHLEINDQSGALADDSDAGPDNANITTNCVSASPTGGTDFTGVDTGTYPVYAVLP